MKTVMVTGSGGLGMAVVNKLVEKGDKVILVSRKTDFHLPDNVRLVNLDLAGGDDFEPLTQLLKEQLPDYVINVIGVLHEADKMPEKNIQQLEPAWLMHSMMVNVMPTVRLAQCLSTEMSRQSEIKFLSLSARVSSITDNQLGGWYSYRMSKTALNMLIKNIAIEWSRQLPKASIFAYHPGTVDTALSKPFQSNVTADHLFSPEKAADYLLTVLDQLTIKQSGGFFDWQGLPIEY